MTKEEILEGNKLIAEFMGSNYTDCSWTDKEGIFHEFWQWAKPKFCDYPKSIGIGELSTAWSIANFHFHDSWDWLMPIVEKINKINILEISSNLGTLKMKVKGSLYGIGVDNTIEDVWKIVVLFIQTYNEECSE